MKDGWAADLNRTRSLDALRGVSALGVVIGHASYQMRDGSAGGPVWLMVANLGSLVYLFFALSGYLVGRSWVVALLSGDPLPRLSTYTVRRVCRILPLYSLVLLVILLTEQGQWVSVLVHAAFLQDVVPGYNHELHQGVMWTLGIEATYYVLVPMVATLVRRRHPGPIQARTMARWVLVSGVVSAGAFYVAPGDLAHTFPAQWCFFTPGILVAIGQSAGWRLPGMWTAVGAGSLVWILDLLLSPGAAWVTAPLCATASALWLAAGMRSKQGVVLIPLSALGTVSYGVYLLHAQLLGRLPLFDTLTPAHYLAAVAELLGGAVVLATLSWSLLERPLLRIAHRYRGRPQVVLNPDPAVAGAQAGRGARLTE